MIPARAVPFGPHLITCLIACLLAGLLVIRPAAARVLMVGPQHALKVPSQAATLARDGDTIAIEPGTYADCAVWMASGLLIAGTGPGVVITGTPCFDRGLFITMGRDITIRGITFLNARVIYHNGAGVRAFGANLTVEDSRFLGNENGILAGGPPDSIVRVSDSIFDGNGSCEGPCAHGIYAGSPVALLRVEGCVFTNTRIAHHVKSRARSTIIIGNRIEDGPDGTASYLIETPNAGNLLVQDNILHKGRHSANPAAAISIGVEGATNPTGAMIVRDNRFASDLAEPTIFVRNHAATPVILGGNRLSGKVRPLEGPGRIEPNPPDQ